MSGTSDQEYFSDGNPEEVINALAHLPETCASPHEAQRFDSVDTIRMFVTLGDS